MANRNPVDRFLFRFGNIISKNKRRIEIVALKDLEGRFKNRIFNRGLDSNGRKIGNYSKKDILIGAKSFRTKSQAAKVFGSKKNRKKLDWVTKKTPKGNKRLAVLEGGYKKLRAIQGLESSRVNLQYRGDLFRSIQLGTNKGDPVLGFINNKQKDIADFNEERFDKKIFDLTKSETRAIEKAVLREVDKLLQKI